MQSKIVTDRVTRQRRSRIEHLLKDSPDDNALVEQALSRTPSRGSPRTPELRRGLEALAKDRRRGAENLQWALIN